MYIFPLQQAACSDRSQVSSGPIPENWIIPSLPNGWRLLSFHFFVNWNLHPPVVADRIWMTRQLRLGVNESLGNINDADILEEFCQGPFSYEFEDLEAVCSPYGFLVSVILLPEISVSNISDETPAWVITRSEGSDYEIQKINVGMLKNAIQKHSGGPVRVGVKGLTYGTSAVECYLSKSDAAFPGDVDSIIIDDQNRIRFVIEYKKHTLSAPIGAHLMTQYYPKPDGRKYQRLAALADRYKGSLQQSVPLVVFYYATNQPVIRLQEIGALDADRVTISRDSGDISTNGYSQEAISDEVVHWLGVVR